jgi:hypothetical protein
VCEQPFPIRTPEIFDVALAEAKKEVAYGIGAWCGTHAFNRKALSTISAMMERPSQTVASSMAKETRMHSRE